MKTDEIRFTTTRSLQEVANILRGATTQLKAEVVKIEDDPFGNIGGQAPDISVGLTGKNALGFGARGWGVQIYVTDLGNARAVELVALGDGVRHKMSGAEFFDLGLGRSKRDKLAQMLSSPAEPVHNNKETQDPQNSVQTNINTGSSTSSPKSTIIVVGAIALALIVAVSIFSSQSSLNSGDNYSEDEVYYEDEESVDESVDIPIEEESSDGYFVAGNTYCVQTNLRVREGPGKEYRILSRDELTSEDYAISVDSKTTTDALLEKGKMVTCQGMSGNWMKISSGWICVYDEGEELVK